MALPSVKTLLPLCDDLAQAKLLRKVLELSRWSELAKLMPHKFHDVFGNGYNPHGKTQFPHTQAWVNSCYNRPSFHEMKMSMADELIHTCGVEYIPAGRGAKSPAIEYCNAGDTYALTLLYVRGHYRVGCWGDIVERGNYA